MKLASLKHGRDGMLVVVSRDLSRCVAVPHIAHTLQAVMDGWAVAKALKENGSKVPIVVMTAAESAKRWADEIGAAGHLAKPFGLDELIDCVERHQGGSKLN